MIRDASQFTHVLTLEDGLREGGIGFTIAEEIHAINPLIHVESLGTPTKFIPHNKPDAILKSLSLDVEGIAATAQRLLA